MSKLNEEDRKWLTARKAKDVEEGMSPPWNVANPSICYFISLLKDPTLDQEDRDLVTDVITCISKRWAKQLGKIV